MAERKRLLQSIADITVDYRTESLKPPAAEHVDRWIRQFPPDSQQDILTEMVHVLSKTYYSRSRVEAFIKTVVVHRGWTKGDATAFWRDVHFLDLQQKGNSQRDLLALFDRTLQQVTGLTIARCGQGRKYLYLDDGLFSGGRISGDLVPWIENVAPHGAELFVATIAMHTQGRFFTKRALDAAIARSGKRITIKWGKAIAIEDGIFQDKVNHSDVLRPTGPGSDKAVADYVATLGKPQVWRGGASVGPKGFFSSDRGRQVLEQQFLAAGVALRKICPNLKPQQRPLGNTTMRTIGFGTMFATYRNCPNNAPLVLWAGDPWYPLLRRVTN